MKNNVENSFFSNSKITRILIGTLVFLIFIGGLYFGGIIMTLIMLLLWWQVTNEYINIIRTKGINPSNYWIKFASLLFIITASLPYFGFHKDTPLHLFLFVFLFGVTGCFFRLIFRGSEKEHIATISDISTSVLGIIYTGLLPSFIMLIQQLDYAYAAIIIFGIAWCDVGAYYGGRTFGKHKLKPEISPKKTIEGAVSGFIFSLVSVICLFFIAKPFFNYNIFHAIVIGIMTGTVSQFGDLFESLLKRDAGVKDSGNLLLSHGGFLDRIDGHIFVLWIAYFYIRFFI